jgi:hypothetical protein
MRALVPLLYVALGAALALPASAQEPPLRASLTWVRKLGAESCIGDLGLRTAVEARLERAVFVPRAKAEMHLDATVEPGGRGEGWRVLITAADSRGNVLGEREVVADGGACNDLVDSIAIVMALAIDSSRRRVRIRVPTPDRVPPAIPSEPWRADLGPELALLWGTVPGTGIAPGLRATLDPPRFLPIELAWTGYLPTRQRQGGVGADYVGWQAAALACPRVAATGTVTASLCAGGQFGLLRATGVGLDAPRTATSRIGWVVGRVNLTWGTWRVRPRLGAEALVPLVRDRFVYDEAGVTRELFRPWPVGVAADVGLSVRVP